MVDGVGPLLELARILAPSGFISRILPGWVRRGLVGLQLPLMTHGRSTTDDEDHDNEEGGHNNDDEQILLQEIHDSTQDKVLQADHGGGDGVGKGGRFSSSGNMNGSTGGERRREKQFQLGLITAAVHGNVVEQRSGVAHTAAQ